MNDYFQHLIERSMGRPRVIRPMLPSRFEPLGVEGGGDGHVSAQNVLPAAGIGKDTNASFPAQRDKSVRERLHAQDQAPVRVLARERPDKTVKTRSGGAAPSLTDSAREKPELDEGADGLDPSITPVNQHRRETAGIPENSASVLSIDDDGPLPRERAARQEHRRKSTSPDGERTPEDPLSLPGERVHDPPALRVNDPHRIPDDPGRPDAMGLRVEQQTEMKMPSSGAAAVQAPERTVIRPLPERQTDLLVRERPAPAMPQPAPAEQMIRVTIGRIDVRAVMPREPALKASQMPAAPPPRVSLEEYLKKQWGVRQ